MDSIPYVVIDAGNTTIKVGLFLHEVPESVQVMKESEVVKLCNNLPASPIIVSSVGQDLHHVLNLITNKRRVLVLDQNTPIPIFNAYKSPNTLGTDRLAGCIGAKRLFPALPCLVIDMGTCITYDFIDIKNQYIGGSISPGIDIRFKALHNFTSRLPLLTKSGIPSLVGDDTPSCIQSGVINGISAEINGIIDRYLDMHKDLKVIICGGDAKFFETSIKHPIFASPDLVLTGLYSILLYNELQINK